MTSVGMFCVSLVIFFTLVGLSIAGTIAVVQQVFNEETEQW